MIQSSPAFWSVPAPELLLQLESSPQGLTSDQAKQRIKQYGSNILKPRKRSDIPYLLFVQFKSPLILILIFAAVLSSALMDPVNTLIILGIIFLSSFLGFWQERKAVNALEKLLAVVQIKAMILRNGMPEEVSYEEVVPGDVTILSAGDSIPGDCLILESKDIFVNEAELTGETYPVEKIVGVLPAATSLNQRTNSLFMGTHVISGSAKAMVVYTGKGTEFGKVAERLRKRPPETEFERGVRRFGYLLMEVTMILVITIFAINAYLARPVLESLLFLWHSQWG